MLSTEGSMKIKLKKQNKTKNMASSSKHRNKTKKSDEVTVKALKHYDVFYTQPPPGLVQEEKERPEDCIPDLPENREAREFLAKAPTKGLWMPLGKEVKVMKCWRCKSYGHRTGDRECPLFISGNTQNEQFRFIHEDPMHEFIKENKRLDREQRIRQLQALLDSSTSDDTSSSTTSSSSSSNSSSDTDSSESSIEKRKVKHKRRKERGTKRKKKSRSKKRKRKK